MFCLLVVCLDRGRMEINFACHYVCKNDSLKCNSKSVSGSLQPECRKLECNQSFTFSALKLKSL